MKQSVLDRLRGGLIVSCQALPDEPLHSSLIMGRMALAAAMGGAVGIRANTAADIDEIRRQVDLPVIGLCKKVYGDCPVFITPTMAEIDEVASSGAEIIATDATNRVRPDGASLEEFYQRVRERHPHVLLMADISTLDEGIRARRLGFDLVGTTLAGYTEYTKGRELPDLELIRQLAASIDGPVIAEGGIWSPMQLRQAMDSGAFACVVGTAITRPREIVRRYTDALKR